MSEVSDKLKAKGLDIAEEAIAEVVEALAEVAIESAAKSKNPLVVGIAPMVIPVIKKEALKYVDKIDGEDDPGR